MTDEQRERLVSLLDTLMERTRDVECEIERGTTFGLEKAEVRQKMARANVIAFVECITAMEVTYEV